MNSAAPTTNEMKLELQRRTRTILGTLVTASLFLSGCAQVDVRLAMSSTEDIPQTWSAYAPVRGETSLVAWWTHFNDPQLVRLIVEALGTNTTVTGAQAALRQARAARDSTAANLFPTLGSSASAQRSSSDTPLTERTGSNSFRAGLDANWELDIFGANHAALRASDASVSASAANIGAAHVSVAAEVALSYIGLRNAQARLMIANANLASQQETLQLTLWRQQAGLITALEVEQARASVAQTSAQLPTLQTAIEQTSHALSVLLGRPPAALNVVLSTVAPVPQPAQELAVQMPAETLRQRPDVRASEFQVAAAANAASSARKTRSVTPAPMSAVITCAFTRRSAVAGNPNLSSHKKVEKAVDWRASPVSEVFELMRCKCINFSLSISSAIDQILLSGFEACKWGGTAQTQSKRKSCGASPRRACASINSTAHMKFSANLALSNNFGRAAISLSRQSFNCSGALAN